MMRVCADCPKSFHIVRGTQVRCRVCRPAHQRKMQQQRNARRLHFTCRECGRQGHVNSNRLCAHCSQVGDIPAEVIEARFTAELARIRWERARQYEA